MSQRAAIGLTLANVAAGVLNYLFQVHAAVALDAAAFGALSVWLAQVAFASSIASVVQFLSLDFRSDRFEQLLRPVALVSIAAIVAQVAGGRSLGTFTLGVITVAGTIVFFAVIGQLQGRLRLGDAGVAVFVASLARFVLPFGIVSFYVAQAIAAFAGVAAVGALSLRGRQARPTTSEPRSGLGARLTRSVLLAFATVVFPQLDVLVLSWRVDETTLGLFSRLALAARIVFFAGAAVLPVLLSHHLRAAETGTEPPSFVRLAQRWLPPTAVIGSVVVAFLSNAAVLHEHGDRATWLYLACVSAALLVSILIQVQRLAARTEITRAAACIAGVLLASVLAATLFPGNVTRYVLVTCAGNALVLVVASMLASRPCRS